MIRYGLTSSKKST